MRKIVIQIMVMYLIIGCAQQKTKIKKEPKVNINKHFMKKNVDTLKKEALKNEFAEAITNKNNKKLEQVISKFDDINSKMFVYGRTGIHITAYQGEINSTKLLLNKGAEINIKGNVAEDSPLHLACKNGQIEMVKFLIKNGANINIKNKGWATPIYDAIIQGYHDIVKVLIENNADINHQTLVFKETPIHIAIKHKRQQITRLLLKNNPDLTIKAGISSRTPLHYSIIYGNATTVKMLLKNKANINAKDYFKETALDYAKHRNKNRIINILEKYMDK